MFKRSKPSVSSIEFEASYAELMAASPHTVLGHFHLRHNQLIEQVCASSTQKMDCSRGCSYCCHFKVVADAVEVFAMADYIKSTLDEQQIEMIIQAAKRNIEQAKHLTHAEQATINQQCPMLIDKVCVVYPVRSIKCRNFHATDVATCRASYENPADLTILNNHITELYIAVTGSTEGFMGALHASGFDDRIYDLNAALIEALESPVCKSRYDSGRRAFTTAKYNND